jgi:phosphoribosylformylglycinamidine synthase
MVTLLEKGFYKNLGFTVSANEGSIRKDAFWFGEAQSRVVITVKKTMLEPVFVQIENTGVNAEMLGTVTSGEININGIDFGNISEWKEKYNTAIEKIINN